MRSFKDQWIRGSWFPVYTLRLNLCVLFFISFVSVYAQYDWSNVAMGGGGFVSSVIAAPNDPNVFYARTDVGGAYRWQESTQSWIPLIDWVSEDERGLLGIDGIAVDPNVTGRVYMLAGTSYWNDGKTMFLRSDDYGNTWDKIDVTSQFKAHGNGMGRANGERLAVDPNNSNILFCGTRYDGLWKSTNRGSSWSLVSSFPVTTTENESGIPIVVFDGSSNSGGVSQTIYAGVSRADQNVYVSNDAGSTWSLIANRPTAASLMPQRFALTGDGMHLYITYGNGGGPHAMLWNGVTDYYNRGAVYKYDTQTATWTDISPENFMLDLDKIVDSEVHYGAFSGISIDPSNEDRILATSINSYRGTQYWNNEGTYKDSWGDNIYLSEDGGSSWRRMFRYYWQDGGFSPDYDMLDDNGIPWIRGSNIHWNGAIVFDPFDSNRAFVTSGNGVWETNNLSDEYTTVEWRDNVQDTIHHGKATWKFSSHGIEETVPEGLVTIPGGPMVSVIADYDGFVHNDLSISSPYGRHQTNVSGALYALGSTTGLDYALEGGVLVKAARTREVKTQYSTIPIGPVQWSTDNGLTWTTQTYLSSPPPELNGGRVAISTDGAVTLWMPDETTTMYRYENASWATVSGVSFAGRPEADKVNSQIFYTYNPATGAFLVSTNKGVSFTQTAIAGTGTYETVRAVPGEEGHVWVPLTQNGLTRTTDAGQTFSAIAGVTYCEAVGLGKAAPGVNYPTVFIFGTVGGVTGVFRSTDQGASWLRVNDDEHEYGGLANGEFVQGDMNVFGRVYMSTAGRGIAYGEPSGTVVPNNAPVASFEANPLSGEAPLAVSFDAGNSTDPDGDALSFAWDFGDGTLGSGETTTHIYTVAGDYTVTLTVSDSYSATSNATREVEVMGGNTPNTDPVALFTASTTSGQVTLNVTFDASGSTDSDGDVLSYSWDFGDGTSGSGVTASHNYTVAGTFVVTLTVTDGNGGVDTEILSISVTDPGSPNTNPVAVFTVSPTSGDVPLITAFDASGSTDADGDVLSYSWDFGDGTSASGATVSHSYTTAGTFVVTLTVTDGNGGVDTEITQITATDDSGGGTCDFGAPLSTALPSIEASFNHAHVIGTGGPDLSNVIDMGIKWSLPNNGLWQLSINTNNGIPVWWRDMRTVSTTSFDAAQPSITFSGSGFPGLDGSYDVALDGSNFVMVSQSGDFTIYFSNSATPPSCSSSARLAARQGSVVLKEETVLYPNPNVKGALTIRYAMAKAGKVQLRVVNTAGQVLQTLDLGLCAAGVLEQQLNVSALAKGLYMLQVQTDNKRTSLTFVKQ